MLFYIFAAILATLKIAGIAGFVALSWGAIVGVAAIPLIFALVILVLAVCGMAAFASKSPQWKARRRLR